MLYKSEMDQEESLPFFCLYVYILSVKDCVFFTSHSLVQALSLVCVCVCVCVYLYIWGGGYLIHMEERGQGGEEKESRRENRRK